MSLNKETKPVGGWTCIYGIYASPHFDVEVRYTFCLGIRHMEKSSKWWKPMSEEYKTARKKEHLKQGDEQNKFIYDNNKTYIDT